MKKDTDRHYQVCNSRGRIRIGSDARNTNNKENDFAVKLGSVYSASKRSTKSLLTEQRVFEWRASWETYGEVKVGRI